MQSPLEHHTLPDEPVPAQYPLLDVEEANGHMINGDNLVQNLSENDASIQRDTTTRSADVLSVPPLAAAVHHDQPHFDRPAYCYHRYYKTTAKLTLSLALVVFATSADALFQHSGKMRPPVIATLLLACTSSLLHIFISFISNIFRAQQDWQQASMVLFSGLCLAMFTLGSMAALILQARQLHGFYSWSLDIVIASLPGLKLEAY